MLLAGCTGSDNGLSRVPGSGFFAPAELDFGTRTAGQRHELTTVLRNNSPQSLRVQNIRFEPSRDVYQALRSDGGTLRGTLLAPRASVEIAVRYAPIGDTDDDTTMVVEFEEIEVPLPVAARARSVAPARPVLTPSSVAFFDTEVGRDVLQVVKIENGGDADGALVDVRGQRGAFRVTARGGGPLDLPTPALAPRESVEVEVHFLPTTTDPTATTLAFEFDTDTVATMAVSGEAIPAGVMTCEQELLDFGEVPRGQVVRRSVQCRAAGGPYVLRELRVVPGSAAGFSIPNAPTGLDGSGAIAFDVVFDANGLPRRYDGALEIVAEHDAVTRVPIVAVAVPPLPGTTDLTVNIEWNTARSDIDLHVVRAGGAPFVDGQDCYFNDKNPDWGVLNDEVDDPFLDFDDVDGLGPEEVNLSRAGETSYDVFVHYFGYHGGAFPPSTTIDLRYRLRGGPEVLVQQPLNDCGRAWKVGTFYFDGPTPRFVAANTMTDDYKPFALEVCR